MAPSTSMGAATPPPWETAEIGVVWSDGFDRPDLGSNWVVLGGAQASLIDSALCFTHTNRVTSRQVYYQPWLTCSDRWTLRWSQRFGILDANSVGVGVGLKNFQAAGGNDQGYNALLSGAGANLGTMVLQRYDGTEHEPLATGGAMPLAAGDEVDCSLTRSGWTLSATASNRVNGMVSTTSMTYYDVPAHTVPPISRMCFYPLGGTVYVSNLTFSIDHRKPARFVVIAGSIGEGENASSYAKGFVQVVQSNFNEVVCNESGSWNSTSNSFSLLPEILAQQPETAILAVGANDLFYGYPETQWQANYSNLVVQLQAHGIRVKHCLPTPQVIADQRPLKNWLLATYPNQDIIDHWTPFVSGTYQLAPKFNSGDGVHPNEAGHLLMGQIIISNLPPGIRVQPSGQLLPAGKDAIFTVSATGPEPLAYQWRRNDSDLAAATNVSLAITNVQGTNAGNYTVVVSDAVGSTTSSVAALLVRVPIESIAVEGWPNPNPLLLLTTASNLNCRVDTSLNLLDWTILTNLAAPDGKLQFSDPYAPDAPQHYYRLLSIP